MVAVLQAALVLLCFHKAFSQELYLFGDDPEATMVRAGTHWTYDQSGDDWDGSDAAGKPWICLTGQQQSPTNLPTAATAATLLDPTHRSIFELGSIVADGSNVRVKNNGHTVEVAWSDQSFTPKITIAVQEDKPLPLGNIDLQYGNKVSSVTAVPRQFHFHTHSEHMLAGKMYPLEAHLVSVVPQSELASCPATGCLVVTAVLYELADDLNTENTWLKTFFADMPDKEDEEILLPSGTVLDLQQLLPSNTSYLAYSGSLTTPPCAEGVLWMVMVNAQKVSLQQWRSFQKAVGDYNCTLVPGAVGSQQQEQQQQQSNSTSTSHPTATTPTGNVSNTSSLLQDNSTAAAAPADSGNITRHLLAKVNGAFNPTSGMRLPYVDLQRQLLEAVSAGPAGQHFTCDKLGHGENARLPQNLNGRTVRLWKDTSGKKSYLPEDAAAAASAGAVAGIVIGTTLGAGLTALIGYVAYKQYQKRRIKRLYNMGVSSNDMMMVQQEVESQWLTAGAASSNAINPPAPRVGRASYGNLV